MHITNRVTVSIGGVYFWIPTDTKFHRHSICNHCPIKTCFLKATDSQEKQEVAFFSSLLAILKLREATGSLSRLQKAHQMGLENSYGPFQRAQAKLNLAQFGYRGPMMS